MPGTAIPVVGGPLCSGMDGSGGKHSGSQSTLHMPKQREGFKAAPSAFTMFGGLMDEHGNWGRGVARKNTFLESPFDS